MRSLIVLASLFVPAALWAQDRPAEGAYDDVVARQLVDRARAARYELGAQVTSYTAVVRERFALTLRTPLKDRTLFRAEQATRVRWSRDGETVALVLASRDQHPGGVGTGSGSLTFFDPTSDRFYFGMTTEGPGDDDDGPYHPLATGSEAHYRYRSGDTLSIRLHDGRTIRAVEVQLLPHRASFRHLAGSLWIEPESGALVRAVVRLARRFDIELDDDVLDESDRRDLNKVPGIFKPIEADVELVVIEYSLWNLKHWLPRFVRLEGYGRAGVLRLPFGAEISYQIENVEEDGDAAGAEPTPAEVIAGWDAGVGLTSRQRGRSSRRVQVYRPEDEERLLTSPHLPPAIWRDAPDFASETELQELAGYLEAAVSRYSAPDAARFGFEWGFGGPDLVRYNRVEGLSVGARGRVQHPFGTGQATIRLGTADLRPNVELQASRPQWRRNLSLELYHRLTPADGLGRPLGLGSSAAALILGRDDGEYYRATGARLAVSPPTEERASYEVAIFAERQREARRGTNLSLPRLIDKDRRFRPSIAAEPADLVGTSLVLSPWWGRDPLAAQAGIEIFVESVTGDYEFARARLTGRTALQLGATTRLGLEAAAGTSWGTVPIQHHWYLGGPAMLRGYGGGAAVGTSLVRARAELARTSSFGALTVFTDAGWAGERSAFTGDDALLSAGIGTSLLDGLLRVDLARALRAPTGWRLELYLDALL